MSLKVFKWPGSKQPHLSKLLPLIPQGGQPYCEPYAGSLAVLLARKPASSEIVNDADHTLVNFYKVIQDKQTFKYLCRLIVQTPYSRAEFTRAVEILKQHFSNHTPNLSTPSVELAWAFFIFHNQRMPGKLSFAPSNWAVGRNTCSGSIVSFRRFIKKLPKMRQRLKRVHFDCTDALSFIKCWDSPNTVMYIDPPYVGLGHYYLPLTDVEHHQQLIEIVLSCKSAIVISGYDHPIYDKLLEHEWQKIQFQTITQMSNTKGEGQRKLKLKRVECVWRNPQAVAATTHNLSLFN